MLPDPSPAVRPAVRWGVPDAALAWVAGLFGSIVALSLVAAAGGEDAADTTGALVVGFAGQLVATVGTLVAISRTKGLGSLRADFGFEVRPRDALYVLGGVALQVALGVLLLPIAELADLDDAPQELVQRLEDASGLAVLGLALAAAIGAPVVEELLFRGLLLRALQRRWSTGAAVAVSSLVFGLIHLFDPNALFIVPALVAVGAVCAVLAVRTGSLSAPILVHVGFNLLTVVATVAA